jgi:hypothetical protein
MTFRKRGFRAMVLGLVVAAGLMLAPAAFARDHFSLGINLPGLSLGIGSHHSYVGVGVGGYYPGYYGPAAYVAPAPIYYGPAYYGPAYYGVGYYGRPVVYRGGYYAGHGYYGRGGGYYHH